MKILVLTAMWPTAQNPAFGSFVSSQVQCLRREGTEVDVLPLNGRPRKLNYLKGILQLRRRLSDKTTDLVHAHYGYVGMVARTQWSVPVVVTYHGDDVLGTINARGTKTPFSRVAAALCRATGSHVDAVIVQSTEMAKRFRNATVHVVPHEIDFDVFRPTSKDCARRELGLCPEKKYVLFAANPDTHVKRFPLAKAAVEHLRIQDPSVELLVLFKEPQVRLALYMSACDALVFPSYQEGSPNIVKQAMACNLPIVATDVGDVREIIGGTRGCYVCPPEAREFAGRLRGLLQASERTCGREHVQHLAGPVIARRLIRIYEDVLRSRADLLAAKMQRVVD